LSKWQISKQGGGAMRTIIAKTVVYTWDELPEEAKDKALEKLWDLNFDHDWWDFIYADAEAVGLKIVAFDLDRGFGVKVKLLQSVYNVAQAILEQHGPDTETYKTAQKYMADCKQLVEQQCQEEADRLYSDFAAEMDLYWEFDDDREEIDSEFVQALCEDYRILLQKEYDYLDSKESIIETIISNGYEFDINGNIV
jgi:hypothetical protein